MSDKRRQLEVHSVPGTSPADTRGNSMDTIRTIKLPTRRPMERRSEPTPIGVAVAEAYAAIAARHRSAARQRRTQTGQVLRKARATG
jgi:hypothetical protein